ncbi:LysR family transcriptional regulator [Bradyrhizobium sp. ISRA443]|uniref:LysR family transcriptional regulator n=1 Tax=unclassified Bradyrhizobium TaxID=2631580 RepID=UPI0024790799|nr:MULTISPECIES: LysR family transcriptional regulator [unclassified Bradyrhizobium]WGR97632.1 LysR family transcriptional regulator [Bradyrhizobium sp. ISRA436]WGS04522.1 LysR family transcriptional regulator [Bradyrhizobium sp. ISRA437]WGS11403.1 LysR family transcriptional regulator [Bradyrhizobium sp. ISRA443]
MDIELARTFVEIVSTGSFIKAAERLNVAQTTVSARIRLLEQQLGRPLFVRNKAGANLTPAGQQFLRFAPNFVQLWQRAKQQVAVPEGHSAVLTIGSEVSLWQPLLVDWVRMMRRSHPDIALRVHVDVPQDLTSHVAAGLVDIAIMYAPHHRPGIGVDLLMEEELVLVTTDLAKHRKSDPRHVHVEWGSEFSLHHAMSFPDTVPSLLTNLGPFALTYTLLEGGSGYFRMHAIQPYLLTGDLHLVPGAPRFSFPVYATYSTNVDAAALDVALAALRAATVVKK